jgi:hypothetical protein
MPLSPAAATRAARASSALPRDAPVMRRLARRTADIEPAIWPFTTVRDAILGTAGTPQ